MKKILFLAFLVRFVFIFFGYHPDLGNHLDWGIKFWEYGPSKFYSESIWAVSWPNQPPATIYLWALVAKIREIVFDFFWYLNTNINIFPSNIIPFLSAKLHPALVKIPSVLADIGIGWIIYLIVKKQFDTYKAKRASLLFLFNPITIYNSSVWGQTDGLINFLTLFGLYLIMSRKLFTGVFLCLLSLYFKFSLIIFLPVILIVIYKLGFNYREITISFLSSIIILLLLSVPFSGKENVFLWLSRLYETRILGGQGNMLTANAFNLWAFIYGVDFSKNDNLLFLSINLKSWGLLLFGLSYILPVLLIIKKKINWLNISLALGAVALSSFMLLTNMHERYLYPLFPYLVITVAFLPKFYLIYFLTTIVHFLNLFNLWFYPDISFIVNIFKKYNHLLERVFSGISLVLSLYFYKILWEQLINKSGKIEIK